MCAKYGMWETILPPRPNFGNEQIVKVVNKIKLKLQHDEVENYHQYVITDDTAFIEI